MLCFCQADCLSLRKLENKDKMEIAKGLAFLSLLFMVNGQTCFKDWDCPNNEFLCVGDKCIAHAECRNDCDCLDGRKCREGRCDQCAIDTDCHVGDLCHNGQCKQCISDRECPNGEKCREGDCVCEQSSQCAPGHQCVNHMCMECTNSNDCPRGQVCSHETYSCVDCVADYQCQYGQTCRNEECICSSDSQCPTYHRCYPTTSKCVRCYEDSHCLIAPDSYSGLRCVNFECVRGPPGQSCRNDRYCPPGHKCRHGTCVYCPLC